MKNTTILSNYNNTLNSIYENPDQISEIIDKSQLPSQYQRKLQKSITDKLSIIERKKEVLKSFLNKENWVKVLSKELKINNSSIIKNYQIYKHILILKISKEDIESSFFPTEKLENIKNIWFLVKEHNLNFDIIIVSDDSIIEHEIKESMTDLFLASNQQKLSLFQLDNISHIKRKNLDRAILQDILSHLFSTNKEQLKNEIIQYISYTQEALFQYPQFQKELEKVINYLQDLYSIKNKTKNHLLCLISKPRRLYKLYPNLERKKSLITTYSSSNLFSILSNCKIDSRFCTITSRIVNKTYNESSSFKHSSKFIEEISTCLNIDKDNNSYKLKYYFQRMKKLWKINEIIGKIKNNNIITIIWNNWVELKMKIDFQGNISFLVEHTHIKKTTTTTKYNSKIEEEIETRNGDVRKLWEYEISRKEVDIKEETVIIDTKKDTASLISIQKWVSHIINMKITEKIKKDIIISKSIENKESQSKEIIKTPFHIDNPDVNYLLSIYLKDLLDKWEVKQIVGSIWWDMRLIRNNGNIDELLISEDGYISFNIVKTTRQKIEKTTKDKYDIKYTGYNIWVENFVEKNVVDFDQDISFQLLEKSSSLDKDSLDNKANLVDNMNDIYKQESNKSTIKWKKTIWNIQERIIQKRKESIKQWVNKFRNYSRKKINQNTNKQEISNKLKYISSFYQSTIKYAVEKINWYITEDLEIQEDKNSENNSPNNEYLFQYKWREYDILINRKKYLELTSFFERKSDIDEELDRLQITIKINKETDEIEIVNDWHRDGCNMCSSHQMFDNIFDDTLEELWLSPSRNDQKKNDFNFESYENIIGNTQAKLICSLRS